jgi:ferritin-like metal-binding protein YciE
MKTKEPKNENSALKEFFVEQLQDIYWAEKDLVKNLKKLAKNSTSFELKKTFEAHQFETVTHVDRLEQAFESIGEKAKAKKCLAMVGLSEEADELTESTTKGTMTRDAALISAAKKVEHYEIASYGTLSTLAGVLGYKKAQKLLESTLKEEKNADTMLDGIAQGFVLESALQEAE